MEVERFGCAGSGLEVSDYVRLDAGRVGWTVVRGTPLGTLRGVTASFGSSSTSRRLIRTR